MSNSDAESETEATFRFFPSCRHIVPGKLFIDSCSCLDQTERAYLKTVVKSARRQLHDFLRERLYLIHDLDAFFAEPPF
jgi:hypothetical protein